jgi:hypothetical protein
MVSSKTRGLIIKRKLILDSPNLLLQNKNKIFILDMHRTSYGHLKCKILNLKIGIYGPFFICGPKTQYFKMTFFWVK